MTKHCVICGEEYQARPSANRTTCGKDACKREQQSLSHKGKRYNPNPQGYDLKGRTFENLKVVEQAGVKGGRKLWLCECKCGKTAIVPSSSLLNGNTTSCGCINEEIITAASEISREAMHKFDTNLAKVGKVTIPKNNTSGAVGVYYDKGRARWRAQIFFRKKLYFLGYYREFDDAAAIRKLAQEKLHGEFLEWYEQHAGKENNNEKSNQ